MGRSSTLIKINQGAKHFAAYSRTLECCQAGMSPSSTRMRKMARMVPK